MLLTCTVDLSHVLVAFDGDVEGIMLRGCFALCLRAGNDGADNK